MPRRPVVTRRVPTHYYKCLCVDVEKEETCTMTFCLAKKEKSFNEALAKIRKLYETDTLKISIVTRYYAEYSYFGMYEDEFLKYAKPMNENRRFI